jgi:hypothetical protein
MSKFALVVGLTVTDRAEGYVPTMDGYRPGAAQHLITIALPRDWALTPNATAEAAFTATNAPLDVEGAALWIRQNWPAGARPLAVGDTVEVWRGAGMLGRVACAKVGWDETGPEPREHWYEYANPRGFGTWQQPDGHVRADPDAGRWGAVSYPRPLTAREAAAFELTPTGRARG